MSEERLQQQSGGVRLEREIGQGAYGTVYLAVGDERYARELRGTKLYRAIPHQEGLVRMWNLVETEWGFYTVMDLADDEFASDGATSPQGGEPLRRRIRRISPEDAREPDHVV